MWLLINIYQSSENKKQPVSLLQSTDIFSEHFICIHMPSLTLQIWGWGEAYHWFTSPSVLSISRMRAEIPNPCLFFQFPFYAYSLLSSSFLWIVKLRKAEKE